MTISAEVDERTLREIHLVAFEARRTGGRRLVGDDRLQQGQRDLLRRAARPDRRDPPRASGASTGSSCRTGSARTRRRRPRWPASTSRCPDRPPGSAPPWPPPSATGSVDESVVDGQVRHVLRPDGPGRAPRRRGDVGRRARGGRPRTAGRGARRWPPRGRCSSSTTGCSPSTPTPCRASRSSDPNARQLAMGGGSSEVTPAPAAQRGRRAGRAAARAPSVTYEVGCRIDRGLPPIDLRLARRRGGSSVEYFDNPDHRRRVRARRRRHWRTRPASCGSARRGRASPSAPCSVRIRGTFTPDVSGAWRLGLESAGRSVLRLDGDVRRRQHRSVAWYRVLRRRERAGRGHRRPRGRPHLRARRRRLAPVDLLPILGARIGASPPDTGDEFERAVRPPPRPTSRWWSSAPTASGSPRATTGPTCRCRGASASSSRRCSTPTRARSWSSTRARPSRCRGPSAPAPSSWPGTPARRAPTRWPTSSSAPPSPTGRLPVTFPARVEDGPAGLGVEGERYPGVEGRVVYGEGVLVGYRFYETARLAPLFPFGHGLSYGDIAFEEVDDRRRNGCGSGWRTRATGGAPRSCRSTCGRSSRACRGPTGSWWVSRKSRWRPASGRRSRSSSALPPTATGTWTRTDGGPTPGATRCSSVPRRVTSGRARVGHVASMMT